MAGQANLVEAVDVLLPATSQTPVTLVATTADEVDLSGFVNRWVVLRATAAFHAYGSAATGATAADANDMPYSANTTYYVRVVAQRQYLQIYPLAAGTLYYALSSL